MKRTTWAVQPVALTIGAVALAGCGGGTESATPVEAARDVAVAATSAATAPAASAVGTASGPGGCPSGPAVSALYGLEMEFNTDFSITEEWLVEEMGGATCQYNQVLAPGATDPSGLEAVAYVATIELLRSDPVVEAVGGEPVEGIGDAAVWTGAQLAVRAGSRGVRVTNQYPPPGQDALAVAVGLGQLALDTDWSVSHSGGPPTTPNTPTTPPTPPTPTTPTGAGSGCVDPADVAAALGLDAELRFGPGASADPTTPGEYFLYCPYELAGDRLAFGLVVSAQPELSPIDPSLPSDDLTERFGQPATWQDDYNVLLVEQPIGDFVVQITSNDIDLDSRTAAISVAEAFL